MRRNGIVLVLVVVLVLEGRVFSQHFRITNDLTSADTPWFVTSVLPARSFEDEDDDEYENDSIASHVSS